MKRIGFIYGLLFCLVLSVAAQEKVVKLKIVETSDVHGNYYPYNLTKCRTLFHKKTFILMFHLQ